MIISTGAGRWSKSWTATETTFTDFVKRVKAPVVTAETRAEYKELSQSRRDDIKDVGGFVAGELEGGRRKADKVLSRSMITLDADSIPGADMAVIVSRVEALRRQYVIYSTRKHTAERPRLRIIFPLEAPCTPDEYQPIARYLADCIGMQYMDPTTFEAHRLMYWPSVSRDGLDGFFCQSDTQSAPLAKEEILKEYADWHNVAEWPTVPGADKIPERLASKQGNPEKKTGVVGAFCRQYSVPEAIEKFLPGEYVPCDVPDRYSYTRGTTTAGAVLYENGRFLYSHHSTDPTSGVLCNAFDLVRLHLFKDSDAEATQGCPVNKLPSYTAMKRLCIEDDDTARRLKAERYEETREDFKGVDMTGGKTPAAEPDADGVNWTDGIELLESGKPRKSTTNVRLILENAEELKGRIFLEKFSDRTMVISPVPWNTKDPGTERQWTDTDDAGLREYMDTVFDIKNKDIIADALQLHGEKLSRNKIQEYLKGLKWDGVPRVDSLLTDYFGAAPGVYTQEVIRKPLLAAVTRAMKPGVKFDEMLILVGAQGIGKSTFFSILGGDWYSDSLTTFAGKEAGELVQGYWILEVGELEGFNRSEMGTIKQFLSKRDDIYRAAYGRNTKNHKRGCIFVGTTNEAEFLRDKTGNRRFWPVQCGEQAPVKSVWDDLPGEKDQIWAEVFRLYLTGNESLRLSKEAAEQAGLAQASRMMDNPKEGLISDFVARDIPADWQDWGVFDRRAFWSGGKAADKTVKRERICAAEIWVECFGKELENIRRQDTTEINSILQGLPGVMRMKSTARFGSCYGYQRGYWVQPDYQDGF